MREKLGGFHAPAASSVFAGLLGAGVVDALVTALGAPGGFTGAALLPLAVLSIGLYGAAGLILGLLAGWAVGTAEGAIPGGFGALPRDEGLDLRVATALMAGVAGALTLAVGAAAVQALFVGKMQSRLLAILATAGLTLALCPLAVLVGLSLRRPAAALARVVVPRSRRLGRTGGLLLLLLLLGGAAALAALSRADWRVLDLAWLKALAAALLLGGTHAWFWYGSEPGQRWHARLPIAVLRVASAVAVLTLLFVAARLPDVSPAFDAVSEASWGLRPAVALARAVTDRDHDGVSGRFGGGDCDDTRADTYPGAEEIPGDGIDQNCEGGDAPLTVRAEPAATESAPAAPVERRAGAAWDGNILIVSIDALRGDRLGVARYTRRKGQSLTPVLDGLAKRGAYFPRAWSQAPNTPRSFPALLTSRYPSRVAWQQKTANYSLLLPSNQTFFQQLGAAGLKPIGIFSHFYFTPDRGLSRGFAEWSNDGAGSIAESNKDIAAPRIVPRVVARLEKAAAAKERFVLWTHLFEPHSSYMEHPEFPLSGRGGIEGLEEKYDYEIAFVDRWVGKIVDALARTGLDKTTAVVVLADHGEAWGEHKRYFHGQDLTEEQLRVPLIVAVPGKAPVVVNEGVALVDVGPTLVDLVGITPSPAFLGRSLLPLVEGKELPPRPVFAELLPATAWPKHEVMMVDRGKKLVHKITDRRWELYDLTRDPKQQRDLAGDPSQAKELETLRAELLRFEEGR